MVKAVKIGTHDGAFHCDEVFACVMLRMLPEFSAAEIVRTRKPELLAECDVVVDVGGVYDHATKRYDHHQKTFAENASTVSQGKKWTTKLSSAGLVYLHYGRDIISGVLGQEKEKPDKDLIEKVFDKVYANFVEEIDAIDNGIDTHDGEPRYQTTTNLSSRVGFLRPSWNEPVQDFDAGFYKAMDLVRPEFLDRVKFYAEVWWPARSLVAAAIEKRFDVHSCGRIIEFASGGCPYKEHLYELEEEQGMEGQILFALFTDSNGMWRVAAVGVKDQKFESRMKLHSEWCALRDEELIAKSGIDGATFVHAAGFIGGNKTREGALAMAAKTIELNPHHEKA